MNAFRKYLPILLFFCLITPGFASFAGDEADDTSRYNTAGALYRESDFRGALNIYEELIGEGITNPDLYYNASNAAYRTGSLGKAILYLERALKLAPSEKDALANLAFLNSMKEDQEGDNSNVVLEFLSRRYNAINVNSAALWSGITFIVTMVLLTVSLFVRAWKRMVFIATAVLFSLVCLTASIIFIQKIHHNSITVEAVIMGEEAPAYSGPGTENTHIFTIHEGTKVVIERSQNSWNLIRLNSGAGGWIQGELMEKI